jgi:hypothetical protein
MERVELFLNELSWENWDDNLSETEINEAFRNLYSCLKSIGLYQKKHQCLCVWVDEAKLKSFVSEIEDFLEDKLLRNAFRKLVFEGTFVEDWKEKSVQSSEANYYYLPDLIKANLTQLLNNTSVGELAERKFLYANDNSIAYLLVNLIRSKYGEEFAIQVVRELKPSPRNLIDIEYIEKSEGFEEWIAPFVSIISFWADTERFVKTKLPPVQGKAIYKEIKTGYYWYFDNFHRESSEKDTKVLVELEVFDGQGKHIGTANAKEGILFPFC